MCTKMKIQFVQMAGLTNTFSKGCGVMTCLPSPVTQNPRHHTTTAVQASPGGRKKVPLMRYWADWRITEIDLEHPGWPGKFKRQIDHNWRTIYPLNILMRSGSVHFHTSKAAATTESRRAGDSDMVCNLCHNIIEVPWLHKSLDLNIVRLPWASTAMYFLLHTPQGLFFFISKISTWELGQSRN